MIIHQRPLSSTMLYLIGTSIFHKPIHVIEEIRVFCGLAITILLLHPWTNRDLWWNWAVVKVAFHECLIQFSFQDFRPFPFPFNGHNLRHYSKKWKISFWSNKLHNSISSQVLVLWPLSNLLAQLPSSITKKVTLMSAVECNSWPHKQSITLNFQMLFLYSTIEYWFPNIYTVIWEVVIATSVVVKAL